MLFAIRMLLEQSTPAILQQSIVGLPVMPGRLLFVRSVTTTSAGGFSTEIGSQD